MARGGLVRARAALLAAALLGFAAYPVAAQEGPQSDFLFLNQERILTGSVAGQALLAEEEAESEALRAEARAIDSAFEDEERSLTDRRPELPPDEFRALADDFDARVIEARRQQDLRSTALAQEFDQRRRQFYASVAPILVSLMTRYDAKAIFDESSVLLADQALNITDAVIGEIDARSEELPETAPETAPGTAPEAAPDPAPDAAPEATAD